MIVLRKTISLSDLAIFKKTWLEYHERWSLIVVSYLFLKFKVKYKRYKPGITKRGKDKSRSLDIHPRYLLDQILHVILILGLVLCLMNWNHFLYQPFYLLQNVLLLLSFQDVLLLAGQLRSLLRARRRRCDWKYWRTILLYFHGRHDSC